MLALIFSLSLSTITHCQFAPSTEVRGLQPQDNDCWVLVERFSKSSSEFTMCATRNAKPIFLCRKCVGEFLNVRTAYRAIESNHMKGVNCKKLLDGKDKLQILSKTWASIGGKHGLWAKGYCDACYTQPLNKHSKLRKETADFMKLVVKVDACFQKYPKPGNESHPADACVACRHTYNNINTFFRKNIPYYPSVEGVCIDSFDTLNRTQKLWGTDRYFCIRKTPNNNVFIVVTFFILLSPLVFYLMAGYFGHAAKLRTVTLPRWLDNVGIHCHGNTVRYEHAYYHEDGWNEREHGWETERKTSRQRKTSSIVREAMLRAEALEKLRAEAGEGALGELRVQSEAQVEFHFEAAAAPGEEREGEVEVQDEAQADVDAVHLSSVHVQVHSEPHAEDPENTFVFCQASGHTETETDNEMVVDTFYDAETEPDAEDVEIEEEASAEAGSANSTEALGTETEVKV